MKSIHDRAHKVSFDDFGTPPRSPTTVGAMVASMPRFLAANGLRDLSATIRTARHDGHPVVFAIGGHVVKTGCSPYLIDLMRRGAVTHVVMNGAAAIHDVEIAIRGETSEDVDSTLAKGEFGMVSETMDVFDAAYRACDDHTDPAIMIHAAVGTDTVHMSPNLDAGALGRALVTDFRAVCGLVSRLQHGVWVNVGSATLLPEVFLKAVSIAMATGIDLDGMTTADMDMIRHYRPTHNVVRRPPGRGVQLTGHHEIMLPLLHQLLI